VEGFRFTNQEIGSWFGGIGFHKNFFEVAESVFKPDVIAQIENICSLKGPQIIECEINRNNLVKTIRIFCFFINNQIIFAFQDRSRLE
jgi:hypothetical protein